MKYNAMSFSGSKGIEFNTATDIPPLLGKVILVTGGNSGLGRQSVIELAQRKPSLFWLAARSLERARTAVEEIQTVVPNIPIKPLGLDLASCRSVKAAAQTFCDSSGRLDLLLLNAGAMSYTPGMTEDGYEVHFGTNYVGHALLTKLLLPTLLNTAQTYPDSDVRIIFVSSAVHKQAPVGGIQFDSLKSKAPNLDAMARYGQSKLADILFAKELARWYPQVKIASVHPGAVGTPLSASVSSKSFLLRCLMTVGRLFMSSVEDGAKNQLWAATSDAVTSGEYYEPIGVSGKAAKYVNNEVLTNKLWDWTEEEIEGCRMRLDESQ
ncbi:unnamed protein product [Clonostachys rosea f. rosea IK726]|jgi:NAD(P)-dependent dehydrogenase (short-subunit alcohol dehydrogenase family)|uniref:Oxidoreductase n=2 Tax=Bionectria ochroleuca TaxID=29856 RepID=A0A0B7KIS6_BIOOC|nr:unnamed protein product [Clonostachys rosea f. rosea IK726]